MDVEQMGPQTFLYGCELKEGKEVTFNPEDDDFEHQLSVRMACVDPSTKEELNIVEVEGQDAEGQKVKAVLATLKPSTLPSVCLGGFEISPPVVFRLRSGSGPIHISGQHLVIMEGDQSFDEDDEEDVPEMKISLKRAAPSNMKDDDEEDDEEDEESEEETPVKAKKPQAKPQTPSQNGKGPKPNTPAAKENKTPVSGKKGEKKPQTPKNATTPKSPKTPKTPQAPLTVPEMKAKMMASVEKGVSLPKLQPKFENYVKNGFKVTDAKIVDELWKWRQTLKEKN
uniref:Nucleophosmin n=1 Tax=Electrophorus electricus TaxID=8005 RepID=A0A4W4DU04_ELEEL